MLSDATKDQENKTHVRIDKVLLYCSFSIKVKFQRLVLDGKICDEDGLCYIINLIFTFSK